MKYVVRDEAEQKSQTKKLHDEPTSTSGVSDGNDNRSVG